VLADMSERRMTQVVREACCLEHFWIESVVTSALSLSGFKQLAESSANLSDLDRMLLARVKYVRFACAHDLSNSRKPLKGRGVQDPIAILFEWGALISPGARGVGVPRAQ